MERLTETRIDPRDTSFTERQEIHYTVKKEKKFKAFDKLGKLEELEEQIGCPLEVRCNLDINNKIFDRFGNEYIAKSIGKKDFIAYDAKKLEKNEIYRELFEWKEYKKTWWLKEDRSE